MPAGFCFYSILDLNTRLSGTSDYIGGDATISIRHLKPGVYVLRFEME